MYTSFTVKNFRRFESLTLDSLARVNLFAAENNVGKTSLLEALFLHAGRENPELALRIAHFRGINAVPVDFDYDVPSVLASLFYGLNPDEAIELTGKGLPQGEYQVKLKLLRDPEDLASFRQIFVHGRESAPEQSKMGILALRMSYIPKEGKQEHHHLVIDNTGYRVEPPLPVSSTQVIFLPARCRPPSGEECDRLSHLTDIGKEEEIVRVLQVMESKLKQLRVFTEARQPIIKGHIGLGRWLPLSLMGEGMARVASILLAIGNASSGIVLIDEVENGLHYSVLQDVWRAIDRASQEFNTQVFATTHSYECIVAAHRAFSERLWENPDKEFLFHRLERDNGRTEITMGINEALDAAIEMKLEIR